MNSGVGRRILIALIMLVLTASTSTTALAQATYTVDPCGVTNDSSALEQCNEYKMMMDTAKVQATEATIWTITSIICTVACAIQNSPCPGPGCAAPGFVMACKIAGYTAMAADVAGGVATVILEKEITGAFNGGQLTGMGVGVMMDVAQLAQSSGTGNVGTSSVKQINCPMVAIMDWLQTAIRWMNMGISISQGNSAAQYAEEQRVGNGPSTPGSVGSSGGSTSGSSDTTANANGGGFGGNAPPPKLLEKSPPSMQKALSPSNIASNAATAGEDAPKMLAAFQTLTGHNAEEVAAALLNGQSPMQVGQDMAGAAMGPYSKLVGNIDENKDKLADVFKGDLKGASTGKPMAFESSGKGGGHSEGSSGPAMPNIQDLMASFMPKKPGAEKPKGPETTVNLGIVTTKEEVKQGLHSPSQSIFDIVGARYQFLQTKFLAGEDLPGDRQPAAGDLPTNIYLKH